MDTNIINTTCSDWLKLGQLLISLASLIVIVWLFLRYHNTRKTQDCQTAASQENNMAPSKWIHTLYIGGIAAFLLLEFIVYVVLNNDQKDNIIDTISFGATLSSLIMSVVAIIFTIVHGRNGETQLGQITQATDELRQTVSSLDSFKNAAQEIDSHIDDFRSQISEKIESFNESIRGRIEDLNQVLCEVREKTAEVREHQLNQAIAKESESNGEHPNEITIERYVEMGSFLGAEVLLACCYSKDSNPTKPLDLTQLTDVFEGISIDYGYGYLVASAALGFITLEGNFPVVKVTYTGKDLETLCIKKIKEFIENSDPANRENFVNQLNVIKSYFGKDKCTLDSIK